METRSSIGPLQILAQSRFSLLASGFCRSFIFNKLTESAAPALRSEGDFVSRLFLDGSRRQPKVALQPPTWGGVSVQLPVPKAPLFSWSAQNRLAPISHSLAEEE